MFRVREEMMAAFAAARRQDFEQRLLAHLQQFFPEAREHTGDTLLERLRETLTTASTFGISTELALCAYVELSFERGRHFHQQPWARQLLAQVTERAPNEQAELLFAAAQRSGDE